MPEEVRELLRNYRDGTISRREFIRRAALVTGGLAAATSLLDGSLTAPAEAQVDPGDPAILSHNVEYPGLAGSVGGYLARPRAA
jgi:carboxymethylenebutenolidase